MMGGWGGVEGTTTQDPSLLLCAAGTHRRLVKLQPTSFSTTRRALELHDTILWKVFEGNLSSKVPCFQGQHDRHRFPALGAACVDRTSKFSNFAPLE